MGAVHQVVDTYYLTGLFGIVAAMGAGVFLYFRRDRGPIYLPLALFLFCLGARDVYLLMQAGRTSMYWFHALTCALRMPLLLMLAPALWIAVRALLRGRGLTKYDWPHALPALASLPIIAALVFQPYGVREHIFFDGHDPFPPEVLIAMEASRWLQYGFYAQITAYTVAFAVRFWQADQAPMPALIAILGLWGVIGFDTQFAAFYNRGVWLHTSEQGGMTLLSLTVIAACLSMIRRTGHAANPPVATPEKDRDHTATVPESSMNGANVEVMPGTEARAKYEKSALTDEQLSRIADRIERAMEQDRLYRDPHLSLPDLARAVSAPQSYVSQALNARIGKSFFDYVNTLRVEDAKTRLAKGRDTATNIALDVGFNSRSSFYAAFRRETGMTPTEFRRGTLSEAM